MSGSISPASSTTRRGCGCSSLAPQRSCFPSGAARTRRSRPQRPSRTCPQRPCGPARPPPRPVAHPRGRLDPGGRGRTRGRARASLPRGRRWPNARPGCRRAPAGRVRATAGARRRAAPTGTGRHRAMTAEWTRRSVLAGGAFATAPAFAGRSARADVRETLLFLLKVERVNEGYYAHALREIVLSPPLKTLVQNCARRSAGTLLRLSAPSSAPGARCLRVSVSAFAQPTSIASRGRRSRSRTSSPVLGRAQPQASLEATCSTPSEALSLLRDAMRPCCACRRGSSQQCRRPGSSRSGGRPSCVCWAI